MLNQARYHYFTVIIPYAGLGASRWHPTDRSGPFSVLSRGAFDSEAEAHAWAELHLNGHPYTVQPCPHWSALALATGISADESGVC